MDRLNSLAEEIRATGAGAEVIEADLSTPAGVSAVKERIGKGDIETLVNNAGFGINGLFGETPLERELEELDLNIRALTELSHAAIGQMRPKKRGTIINVASTGAYQPVPYMATYAATKAYVLSFSEALHEEARTYGVKVTCLCPGGTRTEFQQVAGVHSEKMPRVGWMTAEAVVRHALKAAAAGSAIATPGMVNKTTANLGRVLPRFAVRKVAGNMFKHD
jgi:short-subunit dehydrogenase